MQQKRLNRQRVIAIQMYRTAFQAIDVDHSGHVTPHEVVKFVSAQVCDLLCIDA